MFRVRLFGAARLEWDGLAIPSVSGVRARCVLFRLLYSFNQDVQRSSLAGMLWPESSEQQARTNLRREVHLLRQHHPAFDLCIESTRSTLRWAMPQRYEHDVEQFGMSRDIFDGPESADVRLAAGMRAIRCCKGELLRGCDEEWVLQMRRLHETEWMSLAEDVLALLNDLNRFESAIGVARQILARDPLQESIYLNLLLAYKSSGNIALAMHTYHQCASLLKTELGVAPNSSLVNMYRSLTEVVSASSDVENAIKLPADMGDSRFVGRRNELAIIERATAISGARSKLFTITGEAGIGKTRLAEEVMRIAVSRGLPVVRAYCHANASDLAYWPLKQWLQTAWVGERFAVLDDVWKDEIACLFPELDRCRSRVNKAGKTNRRKSRLNVLEAFTQVLTAAGNDGTGESEPPILFIDDLQWCDQDSLEFLQYLFNHDHCRPVMVLATVRKESCAPDHALPSLQRRLKVNDQLTEIGLNALDPHDSMTLVMDLTEQIQDQTHRPMGLETICRWSGGNPFYLVESVRHIATVQEDCTRISNSNFPVAPKITAIVLERIYRLEPGTQRLICHAAVIGRSFSVALLDRLYSGSHENLIEQLDVLWRKRIISDVSNGEYDFSHACIREACYESLASPTLLAMHSEVAEALGYVYRSNVDSVASRIAMHWEMARNPEKAYRWYYKAMVIARENLLCRDALQNINSCLRIMDSTTQAEKFETERMELMLCKSHMLSLIDGFGRPNERLVCDEIERLLPQITDQHQIFMALERLRIHASFSGKMQEALNYCHRERVIARKSGDPELIVESHRSLTFVNFSLGSYGDMMKTGRKGVEYVRKAEGAGYLDPRSPRWSVSMLRALYAYALYMGGEANKARNAFMECSNYENSQGDAHVVALVHYWIACLHKLRRDVNATNRMGLSLTSFGEKSGLAKIRSMGLYFCAWAEIQNGNPELGICRMREAIALLETTEEYMVALGWYFELAQVYIELARMQEAGKILAKARQIREKTNLRQFDSTRFQIEAELLASADRKSVDVLKKFEQARLVAISQNAVILLFRCMISEYAYRDSKHIPTRDLHNELVLLVDRYRPSGVSPELRAAELLVAQCAAV